MSVASTCFAVSHELGALQDQRRTLQERSGGPARGTRPAAWAPLGGCAEAGAPGQVPA